MWSTFQSLYEQVYGATFKNKTIYLDFEKQAHDAASDVLGNITLRGCLFHLKHSWWRKINQHGLATEFKDQESEIGSFLRLTFGLPFLDFMDVFESFAFDITLEAPVDERIDSYLDYLLKTYMHSSLLFLPTVWASSGFNTNRTTNGCEAFHKQMNSMFYSAHPTVFELVDRLQDVIFESGFKMRGADDTARSKTAIERKKAV
ncbi:gamma-tubulin complex component [Elysia marginata]|uniref:Gamma-tubulin complex component n=1 Tax=Elysia marginata TaxID=1093978 RepID=A0AAV4K196_9GAST|nr:gamma-tubulin complex component [Elysia marginata]